MSRLDSDIREAFAALEQSTPEDYFDELPVRVAQGLSHQQEDADMEGSAQGEPMSKRTTDTPPPAAEGPTENTGLHDIKALARTTRQRISKRHSTQSEAEEALLASSSSALSAVALPEPGKDRQRFATEERPAVDAVPNAAAADSEARAGMPVWIYTAVAVVAAAAVVVFVVRGRGGDEAEAPAEQLAMKEPGTKSPAAPPAAVVTPAEPQTDPASAAAGIAETDEDRGATVAPLEVAEGATPEAADPAASSPRTAKADDRTDTRATTTSKSSTSSGSSKASEPPENTAKTGVATGGTKPDAPADTTAKAGDEGGEKSIDDLLSEATGVSGDATGGSTGGGDSKPTKKELTRSDIQSGMRKVMSTARACGQQHSAAGQVMVSLTISPSGSVSSAKATGEFAGTPVGNCVVSAVKGASFPAWNGPPHSMSYPFLVTE